MENKSNSRLKRSMSIIVWIVLFYVGYCGFLFLLQRSVLFPTQYTVSIEGMSDNFPTLEIIWLETGFGKVESWFLPAIGKPEDNPAPVVIFAHGNAELIDSWPHEFIKLTRLGIGLMLVEYPGYGRSAGSPSEKSITETFLVAYDTITARDDVDPSQVILFGRSLGGGAVCALSKYRKTKALILMSTFTSVRAMAKRYLAPSFLVRDPFDNQSAIEEYSGKILIIHGKFDTIIPYSHGRSLLKSSRDAELITYKAGHNDCPPNWDIFWRDLEMFLKKTKVP
jgi:pimeloyl-ACP methyl ester carboxylesterase